MASGSEEFRVKSLEGLGGVEDASAFKGTCKAPNLNYFSHRETWIEHLLFLTIGRNLSTSQTADQHEPQSMQSSQVSLAQVLAQNERL